MREDMAKALVECYRGNGDHSKKSTYRNIRRSKGFRDIEDFQNRQPMRSIYGWNRKQFGENLAPLRGAIVSNVGKYWPKVYSELCRVCDRRSVIGAHIFQHLNGFIEIDTFVGKDGNIYGKEVYGYAPIRVEEIRQQHNCGNVYFVHPVSKQIMRKKYIKAQREESFKKPVVIYPFHFHWIGHWEVLILKKFPPKMIGGYKFKNIRLTNEIEQNTTDILRKIGKFGNYQFQFPEDTYVVQNYPATKADIKWYLS